MSDADTLDVAAEIRKQLVASLWDETQNNEMIFKEVWERCETEKEIQSGNAEIKRIIKTIEAMP